MESNNKSLWSSKDLLKKLLKMSGQVDEGTTDEEEAELMKKFARKKGARPVYEERRSTPAN
jgi:hypothetical protein